MEVIVLHADLAPRTAELSAVTGRMNAISVMDNVLLQARDHQLILTAMGPDYHYTSKISATVMREGAITVPTWVFAEYIAGLPHRGCVTLARKADDYLSIIAEGGCNGGSFAGTAADEFQLVLATAPDTLIASATLPSDVLAGALAYTETVLPHNDDQPALTGLNVKLRADYVELAAADGFRLAIRRIPGDWCLFEASTDVADGLEFILPRAVIGPALRLAKRPDVTGVTLRLLDSASPLPLRSVVIAAAESTITFRPIDALYPDYDPLVPDLAACTTHVIGSTSELLAALKLVPITTSGNNTVVTIDMADGVKGGPWGMEIFGSSASIGTIRSHLDVDFVGEPLHIAFSPRFLIDCLATIYTDQFVFHGAQNTSPGLVRPLGSDQEELTDWTHLIMPLNPYRIDPEVG